MRVSAALLTSLLLHSLAVAALVVVAPGGQPTPAKVAAITLQLSHAQPTAPARNTPQTATRTAPAPASKPARPTLASPVDTRAADTTTAIATASTASTTSNTSPTATAPLREEPPRFDAAYLGNPQADYPAAALRRRLEGTVLLEVRVDAQGHPAQIAIANSSGADLLDEAAVAAVRRWRFVPARLGPDAVAGSVRVPVRFRLPA